MRTKNHLRKWLSEAFKDGLAVSIAFFLHPHPPNPCLSLQSTIQWDTLKIWPRIKLWYIRGRKRESIFGWHGVCKSPVCHHLWTENSNVIDCLTFNGLRCTSDESNQVESDYLLHGIWFRWQTVSIRYSILNTFISERLREETLLWKLSIVLFTIKNKYTML